MPYKMFNSSRHRLTLFYSVTMCAFLIVLILVVHKTMEWSLSSEQANELMDTAASIADAQNYYNKHPETQFDDTNFYKNSNERLFFYVFDSDGQLLNFSRASFRIEPYILDVISTWDVSDGDVKVYGKPAENGRMTKVMMTARLVYQSGKPPQTVYVGKDVTAMYYGMQKATYALVFLGFIALVISTAVGHIMSGKAIVPLKDAYERQRQFAADASHELRTPLAVVMASADLLDNDPAINNPFLKQVIADVRDEVKKMSKLVGDLLTVARSDNQALKLKIGRFKLSELLEQTARVMQPLADKKSITIETNINIDNEKYIYADEQKIKQVMLILVDNAVKYTPSGGKVTIGAENGGKERARFSVTDTGIGIAEENRERIFDRFFRVDKVRSRAMGGNGLGLSIAHEIITLHEGNISVESEVGKGTKFTVDFRATKKHKDDFI